MRLRLGPPDDELVFDAHRRNGLPILTGSDESEEEDESPLHPHRHRHYAKIAEDDGHAEDSSPKPEATTDGSEAAQYCSKSTVPSERYLIPDDNDNNIRLVASLHTDVHVQHPLTLAKERGMRIYPIFFIYA